MIATIFFYLGKALQVLGMITAAWALLGVSDMGTMMKIAGVGLVEFYAGYGLIAAAGNRS